MCRISNAFCLIVDRKNRKKELTLCTSSSTRTRARETWAREGNPRGRNRPGLGRSVWNGRFISILPVNCFAGITPNMIATLVLSHNWKRLSGMERVVMVFLHHRWHFSMRWVWTQNWMLLMGIRDNVKDRKFERTFTELLHGSAFRIIHFSEINVNFMHHSDIGKKWLDEWMKHWLETLLESTASDQIVEQEDGEACDLQN